MDIHNKIKLSMQDSDLQMLWNRMVQKKREYKAAEKEWRELRNSLLYTMTPQDSEDESLQIEASTD